MSKPWTAREIELLKQVVGKRSHAQIAALLGRSVMSVKTACQRHRLVSDRHFTAAERALVKERYRQPGHTAAAIAAELGRSERSVYSLALRVGLRKPNPLRINRAAIESFMTAKSAEGWSDSAIAAAFPGVDRHAITALRKRLGLPSQLGSAHQRRKVAARTAEQLRRAGLPSLGALRVAAFRKRARDAGWPDDLRPRAVAILNALWDRGPMTRRELADAIGMPWKGPRHSLTSNDKEGSYLAHLMARGLVVSLGRIGRRADPPGTNSRRNVCIYSLPPDVRRKETA